MKLFDFHVEFQMAITFLPVYVNAIFKYSYIQICIAMSCQLIFVCFKEGIIQEVYRILAVLEGLILRNTIRQQLFKIRANLSVRSPIVHHIKFNAELYTKLIDFPLGRDFDMDIQVNVIISDLMKSLLC